MEKTQLQKINFLLYSSGDEKIFVDVYFKNENIWMTQKLMSQLFDVGVPAVNKHLRNIFESEELEEKSVVSVLEITANDGKKYKTKFYNLDAIISVGYRVNSKKATHFRIWATQKLREFIIKGFVLDDERLKNGEHFGKRYFDELVERVRDRKKIFNYQFFPQ